MSNYTQTTFFTPKDTLPATDPNKTIFGAAYDVEFGNISTAIASKPDSTTVASFLNVNVTGNGLPANGIYLPATNTLGFTTNGILRLSITSAGGLFTAGATGGDKGSGTINATGLYVNGVAVSAGGSTVTGSFTGTFTDLAGTPTATIFYSQAGSSVTLYLPNFQGTSNATTCTISGLPVGLQPVHTAECPIAPFGMVNNSAVLNQTLSVSISPTSSLAFRIQGANFNGWTASGIKGIQNPFFITYSLN